MVDRSKKGPTPSQDKTQNSYSSRDKRANKPEFNSRAKKRRLKAKHDAKNRKKNMVKKRLARR